MSPGLLQPGLFASLKLVTTNRTRVENLIMNSIPPGEEQELIRLISDSQATNYLAAAALTVLLLEHISTFPEEIKFVWTSRRTLWSVLYVRTSALTLRFMFREMQSSSAEMIIFSVEAVSIDCILVLRVWLLYGKSKRLLYFLHCNAVNFMESRSFSFAHSMTVGIKSILPEKGGPILKGCYAVVVPHYVGFYAVPLLAIAIIMFGLTLYKCSQHLVRVRFAASMPVISLFLRDGGFLFFAVLLYTMVEIIIWNRLGKRPSLIEAPIMCHAVVGARILLNIKNLGTEVNDDSFGAPGSSVQLSTISHRPIARPGSAKTRVPWYLQTGEEPDGEGLDEEDMH
ncbi:hypothetical protein K438DRAFT_1849001, partial [Mycena galopus ATCC 62051]